MWVIFTEHLTYHAGTFLVRARTCIADAEHTVEDASVNRLESVTDIRKGTCHDNRHRVVDIRRLHLFLDVDLDNSITIKSLCFVCHLFLVDIFYVKTAFLAVFSVSDAFCIIFWTANIQLFFYMTKAYTRFFRIIKSGFS